MHMHRQTDESHIESSEILNEMIDSYQHIAQMAKDPSSSSLLLLVIDLMTYKWVIYCRMAINDVISFESMCVYI